MVRVTCAIVLVLGMTALTSAQNPASNKAFFSKSWSSTRIACRPLV